MRGFLRAACVAAFALGAAFAPTFAHASAQPAGNAADAPQPGEKITLASMPDLTAFVSETYGVQPDKKLHCWIVQPQGDENHYCLKVDSLRRVEVAGDVRFYLLMAGDATGDETGVVTPGLIATFVLKAGPDGHPVVLASDRGQTWGTMGNAPRGWLLTELGPNGYYGWIGHDGSTNQGYTVASYAILAPYARGIRDLATADLGQTYSNDGACDDNDRSCTITTVNGVLTVDHDAAGGAVYPLTMTVTVSRKGHPDVRSTFHLPFDAHHWRYVVPAKWPFSEYKA